METICSFPLCPPFGLVTLDRLWRQRCTSQFLALTPSIISLSSPVITELPTCTLHANTQIETFVG